MHFISVIRITSKEATEPVPIIPYDAQKRILSELVDGLENDVHHFVLLKARQLGACLAPETRVLTADLRWVAIRDLEIGQEVVAVDEDIPGGRGRDRKMRTAVVEAVKTSTSPAYRLSFDDGRSIVCSANHRWLTKQRGGSNAFWASMDGERSRHRLDVGSEVRWVTSPWSDGGFEDGWFGGMLDGEGSLANANRVGANINVSQKPGPVWDRLEAYLKNNGYSFRKEDDLSVRLTKYGKTPVPKLVLSRMDEVFRLIGQTRPTRFLARRFWEDRSLPGKCSGVGWSKITSIEPIGDMPLVDVQTSTGTFIAEGFVSHNSTLLLALDIFWLFMFPGLRGALIADTGDNKDAFRQTITEMLDSLPPAYRIPVRKHNRSMLVLGNGSVLQYMAAGKQKNSGLGRSRALNFVHASECSSYGDQKGLDSLMRALAEENPNRLFIFESTALGFNLFYDMYNTAKKDATQRAFFIGWWAKEIYSLRRGTAEFERWWSARPALTQEEAETAQYVLENYNHEITPEQWAWYRKTGDGKPEASWKEEMPSTALESFQATGRSYFDLRKVTADQTFITNAQIAFKGYAYTLGKLFTSMKVQEVSSLSDVQLRVWEEPQPGAKYVIGVDVSYGETAHADNQCISVWRCFADKLVQVAEYATPWPEARQLAWPLAHLAGCYRDCLINLEITGPGGSVMQEMEHLRHQITFGQLREPALGLGITRALDTAKWFLHHRPESVGPGYTWGWKTTWETKMKLMSGYRDSYATEAVIARSQPLLGEMTAYVQNGQTLGASGRNKDDRVMAAGLAHEAWTRWVRTTMMAENRTFDREMLKQNERDSVEGKVVDFIVSGFFQAKAKERSEAELQRFLQGY